MCLNSRYFLSLALAGEEVEYSEILPAQVEIAGGRGGRLPLRAGLPQSRGRFAANTSSAGLGYWYRFE